MGFSNVISKKNDFTKEKNNFEFCFSYNRYLNMNTKKPRLDDSALYESVDTASKE